MFYFTPPHMNHCYPNPFGATMLNPKINFCLGMAVATTPMPMYGTAFGGSLFMPYNGIGFNSYPMMPSVPAFGFGFNNHNNNYNFNSFSPINNFGTDLNSYMATLINQMQSSFKMPSFNFNPYSGNNNNIVNLYETPGVKLN